MNLTIKPTNWQTDAEPLSLIRRRVFIEEQHVSEDDEWDQQDTHAIHFLVLHNTAGAIGCARVLIENNHRYHIGRVAVLAQYRQQKIGRRLMQFVLAWCQQQNPDYTIYLHAQTTRITFYEHLGFITQGDVFMDAGIEHVEMVMIL
jgi:predicted GNAT family N-acyltransferase